MCVKTTKCENDRSAVQKAFAIAELCRHGSVTKARRAFRIRSNSNPPATVPDGRTMRSWKEKFENSGSTSRKGRPTVFTARSPETVAAVKEAVLCSPKRSARKISSALNLSNRTVRRILHDDLGWYPYKQRRAQLLTAAAKVTRVQQCRAMQTGIEPTAIVLCSDEARFHLYGTPTPKMTVSVQSAILKFSTRSR